jgi:hypothetical protein
MQRTSIMTTFDKREQAFENKFIHDEEVKFKATARRNGMLGDWAAGQLGLTGDAAVAYANELVTADLEHQQDDAILHRVSKDLGKKGISQQEIATKMEQFYTVAFAQIQAGK